MKQFFLLICSGCLFLSTSALSAQESHCLDTLVEQLQAPIENERLSAMEKLLALRERTIDKLIAILNQPVKKGENWLSSSSPRNLAMDILGEMRAEQAVPHIVLWLWPQEGQYAASSRRSYFSPAGFALIKIGKPAVSVLLEVIATQGNTGALGKKRYAITRILHEIEGKDGAKFVLGNALEAESDPQRRERLEAALQELEE